MMGTMASGILGELDRLQAESGREKVRDVIVVTLVSGCSSLLSPLHHGQVRAYRLHARPVFDITGISCRTICQLTVRRDGLQR